MQRFALCVLLAGHMLIFPRGGCAPLFHLLSPIVPASHVFGVPVGTALGTVSSGLGPSSITLGPVSVPNNTLLLVAVGTSQTPGERATVTINGDPLTSKSGDPGVQGAPVGVEVFYLLTTHAYNNVNIVADFTGGGLLPTNAAMLARYFTEMPDLPLGAVSSFTKGTSGTQEDNFLFGVGGSKALAWGAVVTNGRTADTLGTWQNGWTQGQRASVAGTAPKVDLKEGFFYYNPATGASDEKITGATSRTFVALQAYFPQVP